MARMLQRQQDPKGAQGRRRSILSWYTAVFFIAISGYLVYVLSSMIKVPFMDTNSIENATWDLCYLYSHSFGTTKNNGSTTSPILAGQPVPVVIISALRPQYLAQVMESLQHQNPNTPYEMLHSPRYLFVHRHSRNDIDNAYSKTVEIASQYNFSIHTFDGLDVGHMPPANPTMAYHAKYAWYRMMDHLFHSLNVTEALILEDDTVLAEDALLVSAILLKEKSKRSDIHATSLGGWAGTNRINPDPDTYLAVWPRYFQAMAYSMNVTIFEQLQNASQQYHDERSRRKRNGMISSGQFYNEERNDWTEEITVKNFLSNLTMLTPSVGRMHHIGEFGMGLTGNNQKRAPVPKGWMPWEDTITNPNRTAANFYLSPLERTDQVGCICSPLFWECHGCGIPPKELFGIIFKPRQVQSNNKPA
jgi:hypothetical protein